MKRTKTIARFFLIMLAVFLLRTLNLNAAVKSAEITNFSYQELEKDWFEINVDAAFCLRNSTLIAEITNKITGITEKIEIPRVFYDYQTLDASFAAELNFNMKEINVKLKLLNYDNDELIKAEEENNLIAEMLERQAEETQRNADNQQFQEESSYLDKSRKESEQQSEDSAQETAVAVVILLPMLLENIDTSSTDEQDAETA